MDKIKVDIEMIYNTVAVYKSCRTELEEILEELNTSIENLRANWEGKTEDSFFQNCFPNFVENINKHIETISFLEKQLDNTADEFTNLSTELNSRLP